eukprot:13849579-Heterocapsa_arctica.AAC.1
MSVSQLGAKRTDRQTTFYLSHSLSCLVEGLRVVLPGKDVGQGESGDVLVDIAGELLRSPSKH